MVRTCLSVNKASVQDENFFDGIHEKHEIGWLVAGIACGITTLISIAATYQHARYYFKPKQQKNCIRIIWMPMIYGWMQFAGYRFFRDFEFWELGGLTYEAFALMAFLHLLLGYLGESVTDHADFMKTRDKTGLPWPFGCIRFRPSKPYFLHALTAAVGQYCIVRPLISVIAAVCEVYHVLCSDDLEPFYAAAWLEAADFFSMGVALYGLVCLYQLTKERIKDKRPLAKFLSIKLIVALTYYQAFIFAALSQRGIIKETTYWSAKNISQGLNSMIACIEMIFFAAANWYSFSATEYRHMQADFGGSTKPFKAIWDAINFSDFIIGAWKALVFGFRYVQGAEGTRTTERYILCRREDVDGMRAQSLANGMTRDANAVSSANPTWYPDNKQSYDIGSSCVAGSIETGVSSLQPRLPIPGSTYETEGWQDNSQRTEMSEFERARADSMLFPPGHDHNDIVSVEEYSRTVCGDTVSSVEVQPPSILYPDQVATGEAVFVESPKSIRNA